MTEIRFLPPAAKRLKKLRDGELKRLYRKAIDRIQDDYTVGEVKSGDLSGIYGYSISYNDTDYELTYRVRYAAYKIIVVILAVTRESLYDELKTQIRTGL